MGEIRPPRTRPRRVLRPDLGQVGLRKWFEDPRADSILPAVSDELQIVQEISRFQRQVRVRVTPVFAAVGQTPVFTVTVPKDEAWSVLLFNYDNGDTSDHIVIVDINRQLPVSPPVPIRGEIIRAFVRQGVDKLIYPITSDRPGTASDQHYNLDGPFEVFAGDTIRVVLAEVTTDLGGATYINTMRYELIPPARDFALGEEWTAVAS